MSDYQDDYREPDQDAGEEDEHADDAANPEGGTLADVKAMIATELARGHLSDERADALLMRARELEQRIDQEQEELSARHFGDEVDSHLAAFAQYRKHTQQKRSLEFAVQGVDLGGLASDWDHLLKNIDNPQWDEGRHAAMWRSLSREQQAEFKERVLAKGELSSEELDRLIKDNWE